MKRILMVLSVAALVAALLAVGGGPAVAKQNCTGDPVPGGELSCQGGGGAAKAGNFDGGYNNGTVDYHQRGQQLFPAADGPQGGNCEGTATFIGDVLNQDCKGKAR